MLIHIHCVMIAQAEGARQVIRRINILNEWEIYCRKANKYLYFSKKCAIIMDTRMCKTCSIEAFV